MPGALADADWDPRFTIAGVTGPDGLTPKVFDFALDGEGGVLAAGYFQYLGAARVEPLLRAGKDGVWQAARERWELPVPPAGFGAVAVGPDGELALASYDPLGERSSRIWLDTGGGLEVIGRASGLVRALQFHDGALWAGGNFQLAGSDIAGLAVWNGVAWSAAPGGAVNGPVYELAEIGDSLFAAGGFTSVGGVAAQRVAEWNGAAWVAYDLPQLGRRRLRAGHRTGRDNLRRRCVLRLARAGRQRRRRALDRHRVGNPRRRRRQSVLRRRGHRRGRAPGRFT